MIHFNDLMGIIGLSYLLTSMHLFVRSFDYKPTWLGEGVDIKKSLTTSFTWPIWNEILRVYLISAYLLVVYIILRTLIFISTPEGITWLIEGLGGDENE